MKLTFSSWRKYKTKLKQFNSPQIITQLSTKKLILKHRYFSIATTEEIDHAEQAIHPVVRLENAATSTSRDNCPTNLKVCHLSGKWCSIWSSIAFCSSHTVSGTIRQTTSWVTLSIPDAVTFYSFLRKVLKHFCKSPKTTEMFNNARISLNKTIFIFWCVEVQEWKVFLLNTSGRLVFSFLFLTRWLLVIPGMKKLLTS